MMSIHYQLVQKVGGTSVGSKSTGDDRVLYLKGDVLEDCVETFESFDFPEL